MVATKNGIFEEEEKRLWHKVNSTWILTGLRVGKVANVRVAVPELVGKVVHHVPEDEAVDVLAQHVEQEPVAHVGADDDGVHGVATHQPVAEAKQVHAHARTHDDHEPERQAQRREQRQ